MRVCRLNVAAHEGFVGLGGIRSFRVRYRAPRCRQRLQLNPECFHGLIAQVFGRRVCNGGCTPKSSSGLCIHLSNLSFWKSNLRVKVSHVNSYAVPRMLVHHDEFLVRAVLNPHHAHTVIFEVNLVVLGFCCNGVQTRTAWLRVRAFSDGLPCGVGMVSDPGHLAGDHLPAALPFYPNMRKSPIFSVRTALSLSVKEGVPCYDCSLSVNADSN